MKRKIIIMLITVFAMLMSTAYAASPMYHQEDNSVSFEFGENGYKTVLITEKETEGIFYIGQNSSGYMGARAFLIKNNPKDGNYVLRAGGLGDEPITEEFSIHTYHAVQAGIDAHVKEIYLVNGEDRYKGTIADGKATFLVPNGTYTVEVTCDTGYKVKGTIGNITVKNGETQTVNIETEIDLSIKYIVTGTVDAGVKSITISNGDMEPVTITEFTDNAFSCELSAGEYTVMAEANDEYTIATDLTQPITVAVSEESQALITISTTQKRYTIELTKGENVKSVALLDSEQQTVEGTSDGDKITYSVTAGIYTVSAMPDNGYDLDSYTKEIAVNKDSISASVEITAHLSQIPKYPISGKVSANITSLTVKKAGEIVAVIAKSDIAEDGSFSIELESGDYTIEAKADKGYRIIGDEAINVKAGEGLFPTVNIETEIDLTIKYEVTGTVDVGVKSVTISNEGMEPITITEFTNNAFSCELSVGKYTVTAEANDEYTIETDLTQPITVTISETEQALINISTTQKHYTIEIIKGENVKSAALIDSENNVVVGEANGNKTTYSVIAGTYTVSAEAETGYVLDEYTAEIRVDKDNAFASVNITAHLSETPKYMVSGTVDEHINSLIIKQGDKIVAAISEFENGGFSCELEAGEYTIKVVPEAGYEVDGEMDEIPVTVTNEDVGDISITTREIPSIEPNTTTEITSDEENDKIILTTKIKNVADESSIIAVAYDTKGTLISVKMNKKTGDEISFEFKKDVRIKTFKILVWNSIEEMKPITKGEDKTYN